LREVSDEFAALQKEKNELERKLEVLADKIREYREDEDALKDALLIAQKQGNAIVAESKASAEKLTKETKEKVEKLLAESKAKSERLVNDANEYSEKTRSEADSTAEKTIKDANDKAAEIKAAMDKQQAIQEEILRNTRKEVLEYREKILAAYRAQIEVIEAMPDQVENEFIKRTAEEAERREQERKKEEEQRAAKAKAEAAKNAAAQQKLKEAQAKAAAEAKSAKSAPVQPAIPEQAPVLAETTPVQPANSPLQQPAAKSGGKKHKGAVPAGDKTTDNLPFFNSDTTQVARHENLKFGKNNGNKD
ncbi:MAG: DivIVA domain-containing protein, partial [Oscillospiraceae bacterium]|nr:DivIVA domain-containing protein [Oscillospiraceae bacterium]